VWTKILHNWMEIFQLTLCTLLKYIWEIMHIKYFFQLTQKWLTGGDFVSKILTENIVQTISVMLVDAG